jgi:hypothetical protein
MFFGYLQNNIQAWSVESINIQAWSVESINIQAWSVGGQGGVATAILV